MHRVVKIVLDSHAECINEIAIALLEQQVLYRTKNLVRQI